MTLSTSLIDTAEASFDFSVLAILALIQGLTEFLPISSSGHLVLAQSAMGFDEPALALDVALHVGTLLAICLVYRRDVWGLVQGLTAGDWREPLLLLIASVPAAVIGLVFRGALEATFHSTRFAAAGLLVTAVILLGGEWARRRRVSPSAPEEPIRWWQALVIGAAQALAIWPGISRSGSTIAAGVLCGLSPERAARFSFLMAIPIILGAAALQLPETTDDPHGLSLGSMVWAALFAGFVGWGALRVLLAFLGRGAFVWFAAYCVALSIGAALFG